MQDEIYLDQEILDICAEATTEYSAEERVRQVITHTAIDLFEEKSVTVNLTEHGEFGGKLTWITKLNVVAKRMLNSTHVTLVGVGNGDVHLNSRYESDSFGEAA